MYQFIVKHLPLWLITFCCSATFSQVYLLDAPQFAQAGQTVALKAFAEGQAHAVRLTWTDGEQNGQADMVKDADSQSWSGEIPSQAVQGTGLNYTVVAEYDQDAAQSSPNCVLYIYSKCTTLTPEPMTLRQTILLEKKWNSDDSAFGLIEPTDGPTVGPASLTYHKGNIYLLDNVKGRVLRFDAAGKRRSVIPIPSAMASDLVLDSTDDSLVVISQLENKVFRFQKNGKLKHTLKVPLRKELVYPSKFEYDPSDGTLMGQDFARQNGMVPVMRKNQSIDAARRDVEKELAVIAEAQGNNLILGFNDNPEVVAIAFDKPIACVEEAMGDSRVVWVLYTLQDDYRLRRLARVDLENRRVQVVETNVWFAFNATRRMALTPTGVILLAGDMETARLVAYDYNQ